MLWNSLPGDRVSVSSLHKFKSSLKSIELYVSCALVLICSQLVLCSYLIVCLYVLMPSVL